jgi:sugar phosphate isomerase/epimerase
VLQASFIEVVDAAERHGFERVTANPLQYVRSQDDGWSDDAIRRRLEDAGLECTMLDALPGVLPGLRLDIDGGLFPMPSEAPSVDRCLEIAENLGIGLLNITHYWGDPATGVDELAEGVASVCSRAADHEMAISIEFIPGTGIPDITTALDVVRASGAANVGILVDVFHHARSSGTVDDLRQLPAETITAIQLSDRAATGRRSSHVPMRGRALPGQGQLPLADLVRSALANNPDVTIDVEVLNDELASRSPDEVARLLAESVRSWAATMRSCPLD